MLRITGIPAMLAAGQAPAYAQGMKAEDAVKWAAGALATIYG